MIWTVEELQSMDDFKNESATILKMKLDAIESMIRTYTNNPFQNRNIRFDAPSINNVLFGSSTFLKVGDTIQVTQSKVNDGLYTIEDIIDDGLKVDRPLFDAPLNRITKIEYPADIKKGVIDLLIWELTTRRKVGIQSETLSRHSVTYFNQDSQNQVMGYPTSLLGFLEPYRKARF